jgi:hypothetical protein
MVGRCSENDISNENQTKKIQKGDANRVSAGHNHNHALIITWCLIYYSKGSIVNTPFS